MSLSVLRQLSILEMKTMSRISDRSFKSCGLLPCADSSQLCQVTFHLVEEDLESMTVEVRSALFCNRVSRVFRT